MNLMLSLYRALRVLCKRAIRVEPTVKITHHAHLQYYGNKGYGGWAVPHDLLNSSSIVVDIGLGCDISFSEALIAEYGCIVHGFDPTPKSIAYIERRAIPGFKLHKLGVGGSERRVSFHLPNNQEHVSGSIVRANHVGVKTVDVDLIDIAGVLNAINSDRIDLLKVDIEGAEYELISSAAFQKNAARILVLCIEFHHRWNEFGPQSTIEAVFELQKLGFECVWRSLESNEEFTFLNTRSFTQLMT